MRFIKQVVLAKTLLHLYKVKSKNCFSMKKRQNSKIPE